MVKTGTLVLYFNHFFLMSTLTCSVYFLQMKIANAGNSCYMDSVLFSMFAIHSPSLDELLTKAVSDEDAAEKLQLRRLISKNFMQPLQDNQVKNYGLAALHVTEESISEIRTLCRKLGWPPPRTNIRAAAAAKGAFPLSLSYSLSFFSPDPLDSMLDHKY